MIIGSKIKKFTDPSRMIKTVRERVVFLEFVYDEWDRLLKGEKITKVTGYNKGYYRFEVKAIKVKAYQ